MAWKLKVCNELKSNKKTCIVKPAMCLTFGTSDLRVKIGRLHKNVGSFHLKNVDVHTINHFSLGPYNRRILKHSYYLLNSAKLGAPNALCQMCGVLFDVEHSFASISWKARYKRESLMRRRCTLLSDCKKTFSEAELLHNHRIISVVELKDCAK